MIGQLPWKTDREMEQTIYSLFQQQVTVRISELSPSSRIPFFFPYNLQLVIKKNNSSGQENERMEKVKLRKKLILSQEDAWPFEGE